MFEVIYISSSCRQAADFIDRLMWKLREYEIYDVKIDSQHMQLKLDKFIVSAINIWDANLGKSYHRAKYYIDKAEPTNTETWKIVEKINYLIGDIKMRFPKDTKQISEEELIEILTEVSV